MNFIFFLAFLCAAPVVFGTPEKDLYRELRKRLDQPQQVGLLKGKFRQIKHFQELELDITTEGVFQISGAQPTAHELEWNVLKPTASKICMNREKIVIFGKQKQELRFSEINPKSYEQVILMMRLLGLDLDFIETKFALSKEKEAYLLRPKLDKDFIFQRVLLSIDQKGRLEKVQLFEKNNDHIMIHFFNIEILMQSQSLACLK